MGAMTSIGTFTKITSSEFGNKRIWIGTVHIGDSSSTWVSGGFAVTPSNFVMDSVDEILFDGGTLLYTYITSTGKINAYTTHATPDPAQILIQSAGAPHETIRILVIGNGGGS